MLQDPPEGYTAAPHYVLLPARLPLWRVHHENEPATAFRTRLARSAIGGRFDATSEEKYGYYYAAEEQTTALAETILRDVPFDSDGRRLLPAATVAERVLSRVETATELRLISLLTVPALAAVCQDEWLVHAEQAMYPHTRRWAHWLRHQDPSAQGLIWPSKRDLRQSCVVLFDDRCGPGDCLIPSPRDRIRLDTPDGIDWLNVRLRRYGAAVAPKPSSASGRRAGPTARPSPASGFPR